MKCIYGLIAALFIGIGAAYAQIDLNGEFRPRSELSNGYGTLAADGQDASFFTSQRTRLNFGFKSDKYKTYLSLQDVRLWGSQPQLVGNEDYSISVHQAWFEVFLSDDFSLKAGRMELVYDDSRIFGNVDWAQQARSHDLFLFKYEKDIKLHFGIAHHESGMRNSNNYFGPDAYKDLQFLWFHDQSDKVGVSLLFLNNGVPFTDTAGEQENKYSQTIGGRVTLNAGDLKLSSNLYYQGGKHVSDRDISALNFALEGVLKVSDQVSLVGGFEHLSGTDYNETEDIKSFTPFYGTNHKFNGFMDYFYVGNHALNVGLNDIYLKLKHKKDRFSLSVDLHAFSAAADIAADTDKNLGVELDITAGYKLNKDVTFSAGFSSMFASDNMEALKGVSDPEGNYWGYIMIAVTPKFLK